MGMPVEPVWEQEDYAFYSDGTESGASIIGTRGTQQTLDTDTVYHCRLLIADTAGANDTASETVLTARWEYNLAGGGWTIISGTTPVQFVDNANLADGGATTNRDPLGTGGFVTGRIYESRNDTATAMSLPLDSTTSHTELVLHFQIDSAQVSDGQECLIRCVKGDGTAFTSYVNADIDINEAAAATLQAAVAASIPSIEGAAVSYRNFWRASVDADVSQVEATNYVRELAQNYFSFRAGSEDIGEIPVTAVGNLQTSKSTFEAEYGDGDFINKDTPRGTLRFPGGRLTQNLCIIDCNQWTARKSDITVATGISDPDGGNNAYRLTAATNGTWFQDYTPNDLVDDGFYVRNSMWLRRVTGSGTIQIYAGDYSDRYTVTLTGSWQRFSTPILTNDNNGVNIGVLIGTGGDAIDIYYPKCELVQGPQYDDDRPSETVWWWDNNGVNYNPDPDMTLGGFWGLDYEFNATGHQGPGYFQVDGSATDTTAAGYVGIPNSLCRIDERIPDGAVVIIKFTVSNYSSSNVSSLYISPHAKSIGGVSGSYDGHVTDILTFGNGTYISQPVLTNELGSDAVVSLHVEGTMSGSGTYSLRISDIEIRLANTNCNSVRNGYVFDTINANTVNGSYVVTETAGTTKLPAQQNHPYFHYGLLLEPARTNVFSYSEDATNSSWAKTNLTATLLGDIAGVRETRLTSVNTSTVEHHVSKTTASIGALQLAASTYLETDGVGYVYIKFTDATSGDYFLYIYDTSNLTIVNTASSGTSITRVTGGDFAYSVKWGFRIGATVNITAATTGHNIVVAYGFTESSTSSSSSHASAPSAMGYIGGMQLEAGSGLQCPTTYIKTEAVTATRNAEKVSYQHGR